MNKFTASLSTTISRFSFALVLGLAAALLWSSAAWAQSGGKVVTDDEVNAVAKQLYCPVCENTPLDVCPTQACAQWRELIRQKLSEGWTQQQIKDYFAEQYGIRVLGTPPATGLNAALYALPYIAIVVGAVVLYRVYKSLVHRQSPQPAAQPAAPAAEPVSDEYVKRIEEELRKR